MDCVQHDGAVAHADADDMAAGKPAPAFAAIGTERIARPARFQAEHAGGRSRDPDRTAAVAGMRDRKNAGGNRRRRAAGRSAGRMREIPGIARRPVKAGFRRRHQAEFGAGALAEDRDTGIEETLCQRPGVIGNEILQDRRARCRAGPRQKIEVLQEKRHTGERTVRKTAIDLAFGIVVMLDDDRVDLRVDLCRAGDRLVEQFTGRDLLVPHQFGQTDRVVIAVFLEGHMHHLIDRADRRSAGQPGFIVMDFRLISRERPG